MLKVKLVDWLFNKAAKLDGDFVDEEMKELKADLDQIKKLREKKLVTLEDIDDTIEQVDKYIEKYDDGKLRKYREKLVKMREKF